MRRAVLLGAGERMAPHKRDGCRDTTAHVADDGAFRAAGIGQEVAGAAECRRFDHLGGDAIHRRAQDDKIGVDHRGREARLCLINQPVRSCALKHIQARITSDDVRGDASTAGGERDGPAD